MMMWSKEVTDMSRKLKVRETAIKEILLEDYKDVEAASHSMECIRHFLILDIFCYWQVINIFKNGAFAFFIKIQWIIILDLL